MLFKPTTQLFGYEVVKEGREDIMYVNCFGYPLVPSISDDAAIMARVIDNLIENPKINRIVLSQQKNYVYSHEKTRLLAEIANIYTYLLRQEQILSLDASQQISGKLSTIQYLVLTLLRSDPIGCSVFSKRLLREERVLSYANAEFISRLEKIESLLENSRLLALARDKLAGHRVGDRSIYADIFRPDVLPNFTFTRLMADLPRDADMIEEYAIKGFEEADVTVLRKRNEVKHFYHLMPPEFTLDEDRLLLLDLAKQGLQEHRP